MSKIPVYSSINTLVLRNTWYIASTLDFSHTPSEDYENAERIVDCLNAC